MRRFLAFILLLCHMNSSMFLPQVAEYGLYDSNGNQLNAINTFRGYFQVVLGYDHHADDDDNGQNFLMIKNFENNYQQTQIAAENKYYICITPQTFYERNNPFLHSLSLDIFIRRSCFKPDPFFVNFTYFINRCYPLMPQTHRRVDCNSLSIVQHC